MHPGDAFHLFQALDGLHADLDPFFGLILFIY